MTAPTPREDLVEKVGKAIEIATRWCERNICQFDYTSYGATEPMVVRDLSKPVHQQLLWSGHIASEREAFTASYVRAHIAKAALAVVAEELREPTQLMVCQAQESFGMRPSYSAMKKALKAAIAASPLGDKP